MPQSVAGSVRSKKSYRSVRSKGSYVDESLFGSDKKKINGNAMSRAGATIVSVNELRKVREQTEKGLQKDAIILPKSELDRIRLASKVVTKDQQMHETQLAKEQKEQQRIMFEARKKRMRQMDKERANKLPPSEFQTEETQKKTGLLNNAQKALDEEMDDVKTMNQMVLYSKCVTIRDKQLEEQKRLEQEYLDENKRLDIMMEIERLKSIKHREEIEHQRREAQKQGALVIIDQIKERELERINQQELLEREKQQMAEQIEKLKAEEEETLQRERVKAKKLLNEVEESNREALSEKEKRRREELRLDNEILEYNMAKAKLEEEREIEKKKLQEQKEKDIQKLRDLQERAADRQAEIDALRAKRAFEEQERRHRENERKEREHQLKVMRDMEEARETQFRERERLLAEQARQERDEFSRIIRSQKEEAEKDRQVSGEKKNILKEHSLQLRTQIIQNEETTKQQRLDYLEEGRRVRQNLENERKRLEEIKHSKLGELKTLGISDKYQADLSRKKISF
ncbi:unnamed protein product [Moneuplotes crassus]|uniref:Cilia- and flagella-associated protein 45 n=1 Tax=Euplotes crassus TaxID=5936 RepID=A0AAD1UET1_EUPCR|nr:unnamed protein product [Moneuplotes crassus]